VTAAALTLVVRRVIAASPERLFEAWTTPAQFRAWWGPRGVRCIHAEIDPRVGGSYRIGNRLPGGEVLWIVGEFLEVAPGQRLVFTWRREPESAPTEHVTVRFEPRGAATEVIVVHERIASDGVRDEHEQGWLGCLAGLEAYL
jgi:uncharacterized protein YndB with AHSA1/START domain